MLAQYKTKANIGIGFGIVGEIAARLLSKSDSHAALLLAGPVALVAAILLVWSCVQYARGKGYSGWFGAFGLLFLIELIVLFCLKDRRKTASA